MGVDRQGELESSFDRDAEINFVGCNSREMMTSEANQKGSMSDVDIKSLIFDAFSDAENFYLSFSRQHGFGIRRQDSRKNKSGSVWMMKWVCDREGTHGGSSSIIVGKKRRRSEKRSNCAALFRVNLNKKTNKWVVGDFSNKHNHDLLPQNMVKFIHCHKSMNTNDKRSINSLRAAGVKTNQIMQFVADQFGGHNNVGFTRKDLHNFIQSKRLVEIEGGDAKKVLELLESRRQNDPGFYFAYKLKDDNTFGSLYFSDSKSRADYAGFGDVIAFDACYRRNIYNNPLVIVVGVNHHRQTIVFGCALLEDETISSYRWLLDQFILCMCNKMPQSVVTDGDAAMKAAIDLSLKGSKHRLCGWHLERNAMRQVHNRDFLTDFMQCVYDKVEESEFEEKWVAMLNKYDIHDNPWITISTLGLALCANLSQISKQ